jgi:hypothetical protein
MLSYSEFQLPAEPSFGSHDGKQSCASSKYTLRTMTLVTRSMIRLPPTSFAPFRPKIVVLLPTLIRMRALWLRVDRTRASSTGPLGVTLPQTAGSYVARKASRLYAGSA